MSLRHFMMRRLKDALHFNKKYISKCAGTDDYEVNMFICKYI